MDHIHYEILSTATGQPTAQSIRDLITGDADLRANSKPWARIDMVPPTSVLYILIVVVSDDLAADARLLGRLGAIFRRGFPVLPIVPNISGYDFKTAPIDCISEMNAVGFDNPAGIVGALAHHGGLRPHTVDGHVFVSYARKDGAELAGHIYDALESAGFKPFLDIKSLPGAAPVQSAIGGAVRRSELTILVDSEDASRSEWVEEEMATAQAAHIPVLAVSPTPDPSYRPAFPTPHVSWDASPPVASVNATVVNVARRMLARKIAFSDRVERTLARICRLCGWELCKVPSPWLIEPKNSNLRVSCRHDEPSADVLRELRRSLGDNGQGMLVGGTRPYHRTHAQTLAEIGGKRVSATPLSRVASTIHNHITPLSLHGKRIFLSAAMPDQEEAEVAKQTLVPFIVTFIQTMVGLGATVVFGGHPSVTPLVHKAIFDHTTENIQAIELHQARMWIDELPKAAEDSAVFGRIHWHGDGQAPATDIAALRTAMIKPGLDGAVFVGGKNLESKTPIPGIVDEYQRFCAACPDSKAFILGLALGAARSLVGRTEPSAAHVDPLVARELAQTSDPDMATALIVAELLQAPGSAL